MINEGKIMFEYERQEMAELVRTMMERNNTNIAGGNFSFLKTDREGDFGRAGKRYIIMTPTLMSEAYDGHLSAAQILVVDPETTRIVAGDGKLTREINLHEEAYESNPDIKAVVHAHSKEQMIWATMGIPIPNLTEVTQFLGEIEVAHYEQMCSQELADQIGNKLRKMGEKALMHEFLLNSHGILLTVGAKNMSGLTAIHRAVMLVDTMEWNAHIALEQTHLIAEGVLDGYYSEGVKIGTLKDVFKDKRSIYNTNTVQELEKIS